MVEWADRSCTITREGIEGINCAICAMIMVGDTDGLFEAVKVMESDHQAILNFERHTEIMSAMEFFAREDDTIDWELGCYE